MLQVQVARSQRLLRPLMGEEQEEPPEETLAMNYLQ